MAHLIDKAAVVAEIDRRIKVLQEHPYENHKTICHLDSLKQSLDTLEVKEVDLEKELKKKIGNVGECDRHLAKYFFEFGLKAQKGE